MVLKVTFLKIKKSKIVYYYRFFINLSLNFNTEDRINIFENALSCLHTNLIDVMKYFKQSCISKSANFFKDFIKLYEYCIGIVLKSKRYDEK